MQDYTELRNKREAQVARSNKHHPLNQEAERHLHTLIDLEKLDQKGYENLYVLQLLEWGLEELQQLIQPGWWEILWELMVEMQQMSPSRALNYLLWTTEESEPTWIVQSLKDAKDPMKAVNELIEVLQNNLTEDPEPVGGHPSTELSLAAGQCLVQRPDRIRAIRHQHRLLSGQITVLSPTISVANLLLGHPLLTRDVPA